MNNFIVLTGGNLGMPKSQARWGRAKLDLQGRLGVLCWLVCLLLCWSRGFGLAHTLNI